MEEFGNISLAPTTIDGDALHIPLRDNVVDLALTSPPYINAFDYVRTLRLENLWLKIANEDELRKKKKGYVGTESINIRQERSQLTIIKSSSLLKKYYDSITMLDTKRALIVKRFFEDMKKNLQEVYRVLKPGSKYVIVIGNSTIRKVDVESWKVLADIATPIGYKYIGHFAYQIKNPYIRIPRGTKGGKIALDHVLILEK